MKNILDCICLINVAPLDSTGDLKNNLIYLESLGSQVFIAFLPSFVSKIKTLIIFRVLEGSTGLQA